MDDLRGMSFSRAFREARRRGLKLFRWGKGVYGTQLATEVRSSNLVSKQPSNLLLNELSQYLLRSSTLSATVEPVKKNLLTSTNLTSPQYNRALATVARYTMNNTAPNVDFGIGRALVRGAKNFFNWLNSSAASNPNNRNRNINRHGYYQQGGTMNNLKELQKAFMAYLIQDAAAQGIQLLSELDLKKYASQLGEDGLKAKYQEFMQKMLGGVMARLGAKLLYYKKLKGVCPEGEELVSFKKGGRICTECLKVEKGSKIPKKANEIDKFKAGRNAKKNACGSKMKKR